ncbi:MAG: proton-conducting membrane transporter [Thermorudis peleae]|nr:proton-conducting membrane transporter [Thermorudis peleae]
MVTTVSLHSMTAVSEHERPLVMPRVLRPHLQETESLEQYLQSGGYTLEAWSRSPDEIIALITASGLRGRSGSGFPTGTKWRTVALQPGRKVVLINAAESEPASRKDRTLLLTRPHLVLEGALLAAYAVGADTLMFYTHDPAIAQTADAAWHELKQSGAKLPTWRTIVGPARYVAGEASAAVNFINGHAAKPTSKPPRPHERGVNGRPTLVQNVETFAHAALIVRNGPAWFRSVGTDELPGTILLTLNGALRRTGVVEVPSGVALRDVLEMLGCGMPHGVQAVLPGGYFSGWLPAEALHHGVALTPSSLGAWGSDLGCAAITVVPETVCGLWQAARLLRFFADESARQCGPCTFGTAAMADLMERLARGEGRSDDVERLRRYAEHVLPKRGACSHLDGATIAVRTALQVFQDDLARHLRYGTCGRPLRSVLPGLED